MPEWFQSLPDWAQYSWFIYVTFHDIIQWIIIAIFGLTAWGQRRQKRQMEKMVDHIHDELHRHIREDANFHAELGQKGMTEGK